MRCLLRAWIYSTILSPVANFPPKTASATRGMPLLCPPAGHSFQLGGQYGMPPSPSLIVCGVFTSKPDLPRKLALQLILDQAVSYAGQTRTRRVESPHPATVSRGTVYALRNLPGCPARKGGVITVCLVIKGRHHPRILIPCVYEVTPVRPRTASCGCWNDQCRRTIGRCTIRAQICSNIQVLQVLSH